MFDAFDVKKKMEHKNKKILEFRKIREIKLLKERIAILKVQGEENTRLHKKWVKDLAELEK